MKSKYTYEKLDTTLISSFMFYPRADEAGSPSANAEDELLQIDGAALHIRYYLAADKNAPLILFFHGNGEIVADYDDLGPVYNEHGLSFIAAEYRGYGRSSGRPSATHMIEDAHLILAAVMEKLDTLQYSGKLLVMGRSLGSAPAIELAASYPQEIKALLLDSAFAFTLPVLQAIGFDVTSSGISEDDCFHNIDKIRTISLPTYIIHGQLDDIINLNNASELQMESPASQKEFQCVPGAGHNNIMDITGKMYFEVMLRFINRIGKMRKKKPGIR
ncbi:MAG: alpha/beta hydrolase [Desulfobulbaceae bacterium]|nr:alpha/beta hydrolase [Desulfobulbaceae bacterium]